MYLLRLSDFDMFISIKNDPKFRTKILILEYSNQEVDVSQMAQLLQYKNLKINIKNLINITH